MSLFLSVLLLSACSEDPERDKPTCAVDTAVPEICDGIDNDCDGTVDEDPVDGVFVYADDDGDGFGAGEATLACAAGSGWSEQADDCDDGDARFYPGAPEDDCADPSDYNCDGSVGLDDLDQDGFTACNDCDDTDPAVNPGVETDLADGVDTDCDGVIDDGPFRVSHADDLQPIWELHCGGGCHGGDDPADGFDMTGDAWDELVGVPSTDVPTMDRVTPGSTEDSYTWHKLLGTHRDVGGRGVAMPKRDPQLPDSELDLIETWILEGAPHN